MLKKAMMLGIIFILALFFVPFVVAMTNNLLINGNMEGGFAAGVATKWTLGGIGTYTKETTDIHGGNSAQKIISANNAQIYQDINVISGKCYSITAYVKITSALSSNIKIYNLTQNVSIVTGGKVVNSNYVKLTGTWTADATEKQRIYIGMVAAKSTGAYLIDDVSISVKERHELINGDMEDGFTSGVANKWTSGGTGTYTKETTDVHGGNSAQKIISTNNAQIYQDINVISGKCYSVTAYVKITSALSNNIKIYNLTQNVSIVTGGKAVNSNYVKLTGTWTADATEKQRIYIGMVASKSTGTYLIDDVLIDDVSIVNNLTLAKNGKTKFVITLSDILCKKKTSVSNLPMAISDLTRCLTKATGAKFEQVTEKNVKGRPVIYVGTAATAGISTSALNDNEFVIKSKGGNLYILGNDEQATEMGVYFLLQRYLGIRWYIPLDIGEHIPHLPTLIIPGNMSAKHQPSWCSSRWTGANKAYDWLWARRNLMRQRYHGGDHGLNKIINPAECYDKHPEWFPLINGKRISKPPKGNQNWQPCYSNQEMAKYTAQKVIQFFNIHPKRVDCPLGVVDSSDKGYCQCAACQALDDPKKLTFRGVPNYSNRFFTFLNRVAEIVSRKYPDKFLSCLAYNNCEEIPNFPLHPMIMPYLTNDRAQWWNKDFKTTDQDLIQRWGKTARQFGIYDYYYGGGYVIPRVFTALSAESIKFSHNAGARGWHAELAPIWGLDGCKAWLACQLLWDVNQNPKKLVDKYYTDFFGVAKEPMKKYWNRTEEVWRNQGGKAFWFKGYYKIKQMEIFGFSPNVQHELRGYLNQAAKLADNDLLHRRIKLYSDGFRYTELYSRLYWAEKHLRNTLKCASSKTKVRQLRKELLNLVLAQQELQRFYDTVFNKNPLLHAESTFQTYSRWRYGEDLLLPAFAYLANYYAKKGDSSLERFQLSSKLPKDSPASRMYAAYMNMRVHPETAKELLTNPGFEIKRGMKAGVATPHNADWNSKNCPHGWSSWVSHLKRSELGWVKKPVHSGRGAIMIKGAERSGTYFSAVKAKPGDIMLFSAYIKVKNVSPNTAAPGMTAPQKGELKVQWRDSKNKWFSAPAPSVSLPLDTSGAWKFVELIFIVPKGVTTALPFLIGKNQGPNDVVYFDDCSLKKLQAK